MTLRLIPFLATWLLFATGGFGSRISADEPRTWTARVGGFSVEATLVDVTDGNVVLKKSDGKTVKVPLERLSLSDVRYVDQVLRDAENSISRMNSKPAGDGSNTGIAEPAETPDPQTAEAPAVSDSRMRIPDLAQPSRSTWQVSPDIGAYRSIKAARKLAIQTAARFGSLTTLIPEVASPFIGIHNQGSPSSLAVYDIRSGRRLGQIDPGTSFNQYKCISPDGRLVAWSVPGQKTITVLPLAGSRKSLDIELSTQFANVVYLSFPTADTLLVGNTTDHMLSVFDVKRSTKLHDMPMGTASDRKLITLSLGGNYVALGNRNREPILIYDLRNGALAGSLKIPPPQPGVNSYLSLESVAFSMEGTELSALYTAGSTSGIYVWSLKNGEFLQDISFGKPLHSLVSGISYDGPILQYLPKSTGWLIYGKAVVDRTIGSVAWVEPTPSGFLPSNAGRRVLADGGIVALRGVNGGTSLTVEALPRDEIEAASKVVARGGTSEDAKLPELTQPQMNGKTQQAFIESPNWTAAEPATLPQPVKSRSIPLATSPMLLSKLEFPRSRPDQAFLVAPSPTKKGIVEGFQVTELLKINLEQGKMVGALDTNQPGEFVDVSSSGKWVLTLTGKMRDRVDIFDIETGNHVAGTRPDVASKQPTMVSWAGFADGDSLLTLSSTGRMISWDLPSFKAREVTQFDLVRGDNFVPVSCWISPSRQVLIVAAAGKLQAVDSRTLKSLGSLQTSSLMRGPWQVLALDFSPHGDRLAAEVKNGDEVILAMWDFTDGRLLSESSIEQPALGMTWVDGKYLLMHGLRMPQGRGTAFPQPGSVTVMDLLDVERGSIVWRYLLPFGRIVERGPDNKIWYTTATSMISPGILASVSLPTPAAVQSVGKLPPRTPILERGAEVTLDIKFQALGTPAGVDLITDTIQADLGAQLLARGVEVKPRTGLVLVVSVSEKLTNNQMRFLMLATGKEMSIQETRVDCELALRDVTGKTLWQRTQAFYNEGQRLIETVPVGTTASDHLRRLQWREVLKWFESGGLPETIYEALPSAGLGESVLGPHGEMDAKTY